MTAKGLEGHARAAAEHVHTSVDEMRAVLLHELSLEPSEACVEAMATAICEARNKFFAVNVEHKIDGEDFDTMLARTALQSLRDARRKEIKDQ